MGILKKVKIINKKLNVLRNHSIKYLNRSIIEKDSSEE